MCVTDKLYVVGGSDGQQSLSSVEIYDITTNAWSLGPSLSTPRANVAVALVQDKLFAVGGFSGKVCCPNICLGGGDSHGLACLLKYKLRSFYISKNKNKEVTHGRYKEILHE